MTYPAPHDGPLSWVYPEITLALDEVERALNQPDWSEAGLRIGVRAHLHQISGALRMVELPASRCLAEHLEAVVEAAGGTHPGMAAARAMRDAITSLRADLALRLQHGSARDLDLLPSLGGLCHVLQREADPVLLFHPDLAALPSAGAQQCDPAAAAQARAAFQRALLTLLRTTDPAAPLQALAAILHLLADTTPGHFGSRRWQWLAALLPCCVDATAIAPARLRGLLARVDRQLRALAHGDDADNPALLRELLYLAAQLEHPPAALSEVLRSARVAELLADAPPPAQPEAEPAQVGPARAAAAALERAEALLEGWYRDVMVQVLPAQIHQELQHAAQQLEPLGEDTAVYLLDRARTLLLGFSGTLRPSETRLEPVVEIIAGLRRHAEALASAQAGSAQALDALRERLAALVVEPAAKPGSAAAGPPAAGGAAAAADRSRELVADAVNESVFGIFLEEADQLLRKLHDDARSLAAGNRSDSLPQGLRSALQTLRGSGLMAGVLPLAQLAGELDQTLAVCAMQGTVSWEATACLVDEAALAMERWLARLATDRSLPLPAGALIDRARALRSQPTLTLAPLISLQDIFLEEAGDRLHDLRLALGAQTTQVAEPADAVRAVHTLAGIARTAGHPGVAELAAAMEQLLRQLQQSQQRGNAAAIEHLHQGHQALQAMRASLVAGAALHPAPELVRALQHGSEQLQHLRHQQQLRQVPGLPAELSMPDTLLDTPDPELVPVFLEECNELMPRLNAALAEWRAQGGQADAALGLQRGLHTLKGSARMAGAFRQGTLAHRLEDLVLQSVNQAGAEASQAGIATVQAGLDALAAGIAALAQGQSAGFPPAPEAGDALPGEAFESFAGDTLAQQPTEGLAAGGSAPSAAQRTPRAGSGDLPPAEVAADAPAGLRIKVELLDRMSNAAGEAGITRARIESEATGLKRGLLDLAENIQRLKAQLREIELQAEQGGPGLAASAPPEGFDPLELDRYSRAQELARSLAEGIDDVQTVHHGLRRSVEELELALRQQGRVVRDLQQDLLRARMVPFASLSDRLQRTVRQAARESGHALQLDILGGQHEVDRAILERLAAPLEHLLRNAAVHAIESAELRSALGKPEVGQLQIRLMPGDHEVEVRVSDDGRGIDLERVRAQAERHGLLAAPQQPGDQELLQLIFRSGFSTAAHVTTLAGRGVGLDVVRSEVLGLGGRIHVDTRSGSGTDFTLVIPVTLATVQAVVVRAGEAWFAIPAPLVEQIRPVGREVLGELQQEGCAVWQDLRYPFTSLSRVLQQGEGSADLPLQGQLLFLRSADRRCALCVDELSGTQEIVVKTVSPHLSRLPGVQGASVLGNGRIVLILNPVPLTVGLDGVIPPALQAPMPTAHAACVMVVDDSLTVRRVSSRLLERAGYQVLLAKDGVDALEQLQAHQPDAMLLDVEMPRMDGFELIRRLRANPHTAGLPVVVISSRTAERHRNHAAELGVDGYLGKPFRDDELLALLAHLVPQPARQPDLHSLPG